jgi:hypothetical protein
MPPAATLGLGAGLVNQWKQVKAVAPDFEMSGFSFARRARRPARLCGGQGEEGSLITGQYTYVVEAEVHLGDPNSSYENTRFLELAPRH